jgi:hypothetical protein
MEVETAKLEAAGESFAAFKAMKNVMAAQVPKRSCKFTNNTQNGVFGAHAANSHGRCHWQSIRHCDDQHHWDDHHTTTNDAHMMSKSTTLLLILKRKKKTSTD